MNGTISLIAEVGDWLCKTANAIANTYIHAPPAINVSCIFVCAMTQNSATGANHALRKHVKVVRVRGIVGRRTSIQWQYCHTWLRCWQRRLAAQGRACGGNVPPIQARRGAAPDWTVETTSGCLGNQLGAPRWFPIRIFAAWHIGCRGL